MKNNTIIYASIFISIALIVFCAVQPYIAMFIDKYNTLLGAF